MRHFFKDEMGAIKFSVKSIIILGIILLVLISLLTGYLLINKNKETEKNTKNHQSNTISDVVNPAIFDKTLDIDIQQNFNNEALGNIANGYYFHKGYYLVITKNGDKEYSSDFPGDRVIWVKQENNKTIKKVLVNGNYLISLITKKTNGNSPFLQYNGNTYFVFYEREGLADRGNNKKGYVYQIEQNETIKKVYETKGVFGGVEEIEDGSGLVILDKSYLEDRGMYPTALKPYQLKHVQILDKGNQVIKTEIKRPVDEKIKEVEKGSN